MNAGSSAGWVTAGRQARHSVGLLDIGSSKFACLIVAPLQSSAATREKHCWRVLGTGVAPAHGLSAGRVVALEAAEQVVERIRTCLLADAEAPPLSISIGVATFPKCGVTAQQLLEYADKSLYAMKEQSKKGRVEKRRADLRDSDPSKRPRLF